MRATVREVVTQAVEQAISSSLGEAATAFEPIEEAAKLVPSVYHIASIGFDGALSGMLTIVTTEPVILAMSDEGLRAEITDEAIARDVLGELANLTLGRVKTNLLNMGLEMMISVPTTITCSEVRFGFSRNTFHDWRIQACDAGTICFVFHADLSRCPPSFTLEANEETMSEADSVLF